MSAVRTDNDLIFPVIAPVPRTTVAFDLQAYEHMCLMYLETARQDPEFEDKRLRTKVSARFVL